MLYFIPAWYQQNKWCENEQKWYVRRMHTEFDDTVKQVQLFHRSGAYPYLIMLLGHSPNFRHFLHRQSVYHAPYWSCFDAIQEVRRKKVMMFSFHDIKWPPHTEFIYSSFAVLAMQDGEKYAQIEFGEDGNPIQIDMYQEGKLQRRNLYDDRGFVSSTLLYEQGKLLYQDYLMENGTWKLRCFQSDGHVEVNPKHPEYLLVRKGYEKVKCFSKRSYAHISQVIIEVLLSYLEMTDESDLFCAAVHELHAEVLQEALRGKKIILSFFEDRYPCEQHPEISELLDMAGCIVTDTWESLKKIRGIINNPKKNIWNIPPYDSRADFGISQQLEVQKILVPVDGMEETLFQKLVTLLGEYLLTNEYAQIHLFTRKADYGWDKQLLEKTRRYLKEAGLAEGWAVKERERVLAENNLEEGAVPVRFFVEQCVDELSVSKCMREQRILVDMREIPELYLQITALSIAIPQIVYTKTQFVRHKENGFIMKDVDRLPELLAYYLESLKNWNDAMISSYKIGKKYTTDVLIEKWKEVIYCFGYNSYITTGE